MPKGGEPQLLTLVHLYVPYLTVDAATPKFYYNIFIGTVAVGFVDTVTR